MLTVQAIANESCTNLFNEIMSRERELRGSNTTFVLSERRVWKHTKFPGWINIKRVTKDIIIFEVISRSKTQDWKIEQAFISYLNRHFYKSLSQINIIYRGFEE